MTQLEAWIEQKDLEDQIRCLSLHSIGVVSTSKDQLGSIAEVQRQLAIIGAVQRLLMDHRLQVATGDVHCLFPRWSEIEDLRSSVRQAFLDPCGEH